MLEKKYYKQDLCEDAGRCKLYNPLLTQGQCEYYNKMCELIEELAIYKRALELENEERFKNEEANTTIYELIKVFIYQFTNGEIRIAKRQELTQQHEDKGESDEND